MTKSTCYCKVFQNLIYPKWIVTRQFVCFQDQYYSVQTTEGEQISQLIAGYIDIILKRRARKERFGDDGNEEEAMEEDLVTFIYISFVYPTPEPSHQAHSSTILFKVTPGRAITMVGLPGANYKKVEASNLAKPGVLRNPNGELFFQNKRQKDVTRNLN